MSLVELLVVMGIIGILLTFGISAFQKATQGSPLDNALGGIAAGMDLARQTAMSQSTYTWVALAEGTDAAGANEVTMVIFGSRTGDLGSRTAADLQLIARTEKFPGVKFGENGDLTSVKVPTSSSPTGPLSLKESDFSFPSSLAPTADQGKTFDRLVMFTPQGTAALARESDVSASQVPLYEALQVVLVPSKGKTASATEKKSASMVYVNGLTGQPTIYRPSVL